MACIRRIIGILMMAMMIFCNISFSSSACALQADLPVMGENCYFRPDSTEEALRADVDAVADMVVRGIGPEWSDEEKVLYLHEWMVANVTYDYEMESPYRYDAYGALVLKEAVCMGYALAFRYLAVKAGLNCWYVNGWAGASHAWNLVQIGDCAYFLDCDRADDDYGNHCSHICLLRSQEGMESTGEYLTEIHSYQEGNPPILSDHDSYYWNQAGVYNTLMPHVGRKWAYLNYQLFDGSYVYYHDYETGEDKALYRICDGYCAEYDCLASLGDCFILGDRDRLLLLDSTTGEVKESVVLTDEEKQMGEVRGLSVKNGIVTYDLYDPNDNRGNIVHSGMVDWSRYASEASAVNVADIVLSKNSIHISVGSRETITAEVLPLEPTDRIVRWYSENPEVASVYSGIITGHSAGITRIIASLDDERKSAVCEVRISERIRYPDAISIMPDKIELRVGETAELRFTVEPEGANVDGLQWVSKNPDVVKVSDTGVITAIGSGEAKINAVVSIPGSIVVAVCDVTIQSENEPEIILGDLTGDGNRRLTTTTHLRIQTSKMPGLFRDSS